MNSILLPLAQAAAVPSSRTWFDNPAIQNKLGYALVETLAMTFVSGAITVILGLLLGLALVSTGKRGQFRNPTLYWVLSQIVNIGRSMPFIILMVALIPLTRLLVGTSLGWQAACVPLTIGAIPFYARLVETAINDVDRGKVEAALMMGASGRQITWGVLVREALPILIQSATVTIITLLGYSAMAGAVGGGGVGDLAIQYGYQRNQVDVMVITVVVIVGIVGIPGLFKAIFTATEGAAVAVVYALVLSFIYRTIKPGDLPRILLSATRTSSVVIFLIGLSSIMSYAMTFSNIPRLIGEWLVSVTDSPVMFLLIMMVILLIIGIPLDATPAVLIFTPIFLPIATSAYGISPVHLGMMMIFNMCIAVISPPSAPVLFVGARVAGKKVEEVIKPLMPFFVALIVMLLVIQYVPALSLALPRAAGLISGG